MVSLLLLLHIIIRLGETALGGDGPSSPYRRGKRDQTCPFLPVSWLPFRNRPFLEPPSEQAWHSPSAVFLFPTACLCLRQPPLHVRTGSVTFGDRQSQRAAGPSSNPASAAATAGHLALSMFAHRAGVLRRGLGGGTRTADPSFCALGPALVSAAGFAQPSDSACRHAPRSLLLFPLVGWRIASARDVWPGWRDPPPGHDLLTFVQCCPP